MSIPAIDFAQLNVLAVVRHSSMTQQTRIVYDTGVGTDEFYIVCINDEHDQLARDFAEYMKSKPDVMYLYSLCVPDNDRCDRYDSCVVVAPDVATAIQIHPANTETYRYPPSTWGPNGSWAKSPDQVTSTCIGVADAGLRSGTVICASLN